MPLGESGGLHFRTAAVVFTTWALRLTGALGTANISNKLNDFVLDNIRTLNYIMSDTYHLPVF